MIQAPCFPETEAGAVPLLLSSVSCRESSALRNNAGQAASLGVEVSLRLSGLWPENVKSWKTRKIQETGAQ